MICGDSITERMSGGRGHNYPLCKKKECFNIYQTLKIAVSLPIPDKKVDWEAHFNQKKLERYDGFCGRCGKPIKLDFRNHYLRHGSIRGCDKASTSRKTGQKPTWCRVFGRRQPQPKPRIYLKPWQDPNSLFCDTEFLETEIVHKKLRTGEECSDIK